MGTMAFFHMNQLGDLLFSLPVIAAARRRWPEKRLVSVIRPALAPLLGGAGIVDGIIERPRSGIGAAISVARRLAGERIDEAILFSESPEVLLSCYSSGIGRRYGFESASLRFLLTDRVPRRGVPSLANNRRLAEAAGITNVPETYCGMLRIPESERVKAREWLQKAGVRPQSFVVIAPGSSRRRTEKCWPADSWRHLVEAMTREGMSPVLCGAPAEHTELERLAAGRPVFFAPDGLLSLAAVFAEAKAFAGIDSGAMHLAAALGLPVVALFGPTDPAQVGPQPHGMHRIIQKKDMSGITVDEVRRQVGEVIAKG